MRWTKNRSRQFLAIGLLMLSSTAHAAPYELIRTYYGSNQSWLYGWSMAALPNNWLLVGSIQDRTGADAAGAAYVLNANNGGIIFTITSPTRFEHDNFGWTVAAVGSNLLISGATGRPCRRGFSGRCLPVQQDGVLLRTFKVPTPGLLYGTGLAVIGNKILITEEEGPGGKETAYIYDANNGALVRTISNIGNRAGPRIPNAHVTVAGTDVLIGTPGNNGYAGGAALYDTTNGNLLRTFSNPFITTQDNFGFAVATLPGNRFAISAPWADRGAIDAGAVYIMDAPQGHFCILCLIRTLQQTDTSAGRSRPSATIFWWERRLTMWAPKTQAPHTCFPARRGFSCTHFLIRRHKTMTGSAHRLPPSAVTF